VQKKVMISISGSRFSFLYEEMYQNPLSTAIVTSVSVPKRVDDPYECVREKSNLKL